MPARASMAGPDASPSMQSPWNVQMPAKVSPLLRATRMWPSSVWFMPKIERPRTMVPTPMPVPTVTYAKSSRPCAAPQRPSASAAPFTSVSKPTGAPKRRPSRTREIGVAPAGLGGRGDETVGGRARPQVDRAERRDAERARRAVLRAPAIEHRLDLPQGFFAFAGRQPLDRAHVVRAGAEDAHTLGAAQFDAGE